jgi:hypothetical protein
MLKILFFTFVFLFSGASQACIAAQAEDYVLLNALPPSAHEKNVIAKVKLLTNNDRSGAVRVIEAIKGVYIGQEFEVEVSRSSCSHLENRIRFMDLMSEAERASISDTYYLAGEWKQLKDKKVFVGSWREVLKYFQY